jgi:hypothetical protein
MIEVPNKIEEVHFPGLNYERLPSSPSKFNIFTPPLGGERIKLSNVRSWGVWGIWGLTKI